MNQTTLVARAWNLLVGTVYKEPTQGTFLSSKSALIHGVSDIHGTIGPRPNVIQTMEKGNKEIFIYLQLFFIYRITYVVSDFPPTFFTFN